MDIQGKVAIVTGGASGLGAATVRAIIAAGGKAVIFDRNEKLGQQFAVELGPNARFAKGDVTDSASIDAGIKLAVAEFAALHIAVNCAGVGAAQRTISKQGPANLDVFKTAININLIGTFDMIRQAAFQMDKNEGTEDGEKGVIINTASVAAFDGQIGQSAYSASKGGIVGMTLPIARDLSRHGIRVMTIAPGLFDTPLLAALPEDAKKSLGAQVPFPSRLGKPSEYALLALQIIANPMLNGEVIRLDGAIRMAPK
ncbi:3-hydroxyacyl-CoA dehydrogenase [Candidatus Sumerlaeota bacterium]|nr:3-hydroxyacyl-CoA dehydrogenase [Candidatus Sumerlaeota bacterium]